MSGVEDVIIIGAGVAGLSCARDLVAAGRRVLVLERSHTVGGRCATRVIEGQPVDYGPVFLHGEDPAFLAAVQSVPGAVADWPRRVHGAGAPCQPDSLQKHQSRFTMAQGVAAFPAHLAAGLTIRLSTTVVGVKAEANTLLVRTTDGEVLEAKDVVIALPVEQGLQLMTGLAAAAADKTQLAGITALLCLFRTVPCLTVVAGYNDVAPVPFDMLLPDASDSLQLIANDTSKRGANDGAGDDGAAAGTRVLVLQASPRWSRAHLEHPEASWAAALIAEAAVLLGAWAGTPRFMHPHRWRYARVQRGTELQQPLRLTLSGGQRVGVAGELFAPGGGVQAAWLSGTRLAHRLLQESL